MRPLFSLLPLAPLLLAAAGCASAAPAPAQPGATRESPARWPAFAAEAPAHPAGLSVERVSIGRSSGGLEIPLFTISGPGETDPGRRPAVLLVAGVDGRHTEGRDADGDGKIAEDGVGGVDLNRNFPLPLLSFKRSEVERLGDDLWQLTMEVANEKIIPTRSQLAQNRGIGAPDILTTTLDAGSVVTAGRMSNLLDRQMNAIRHEPGRIQVEDGIPGQDSRIFRILIEAAPGAEVTLRYSAEKARHIEMQLTLK